ncbi:MAG TPA: hypothetical protein VMV13_02885 [Candidatus Binataceae bacterium]|nr:hypothetical protein [Candidatus Binataceae bacterium]
MSDLVFGALFYPVLFAGLICVAALVAAVWSMFTFFRMEEQLDLLRSIDKSLRQLPAVQRNLGAPE